MTGDAVFRQAMRLLGYTNAQGEVDGGREAGLFRRATALVNQIYADLSAIENGEGGEPLERLSQELPLSLRTQTDVMPYGVAMLIAQSEGDDELQGYYASVYNQKRQAVHRREERIGDMLPGRWLL